MRWRSWRRGRRWPATGAAKAGDWVGDLPGGPLASGAEPPTLEEIWRGGVFVRDIHP